MTLPHAELLGAVPKSTSPSKATRGPGDRSYLIKSPSSPIRNPTSTPYVTQALSSTRARVPSLWAEELTSASSGHAEHRSTPTTAVAKTNVAAPMRRTSVCGGSTTTRPATTGLALICCDRR